MNTEISDAEFLEYYECLTRMMIPSRFISEADTHDTDVITATDFIHGAAWQLLDQNIVPDEIFLRDMNRFLASLQQIIETPHIKKYNYRYMYCKKFTETMSKVYQGLLQRHVKPVPFDLPLTEEESLQRYLETIKKSQKNVRENYHKFESFLPLAKYNIFVLYKGKEILTKIFIDRKGHYSAYTNIYFDEESPMLLCIGESAQDAFEKLLVEISKSCSDFSSDDHSCIFNKYF